LPLFSFYSLKPLCYAVFDTFAHKKTTDQGINPGRLFCCFWEFLGVSVLSEAVESFNF